MKKVSQCFLLVGALIISTASLGQTPATAPTAKPAASAPPATLSKPALPENSTPAIKKATPATPATSAAAGGGDGKVWVNTASNTYHCPGTKYYGKTKKGEYMTEADAKAKGNHADHKKACS